MRCPACNASLDRVENPTGEAAMCNGCGGLWVDWPCWRAIEANVLDPAVKEAAFAGIALVRKKEEAAGAVFRMTAQRAERERACIVCQKLLVAKAIPAGTTIDVCAEHGVWFDVGELWTALQQVGIERAVRTSRHDPEPRKEPMTLLELLGWSLKHW